MGHDDESRIELPYGPGTKVSWIVRTTVADSEPTLVHALTMLDVERVIGAYLADHDDEVIRIVHGLTSRTLHLTDGSAALFEWEAQISDRRCMDCGADTDAIYEYYMLHDEVWKHVVPESTGQLCIRCCEHRLNRTLTAADFMDCHVNTRPDLLRSPRLAVRLRARPASPRQA